MNKTISIVENVVQGPLQFKLNGHLLRLVKFEGPFGDFTYSCRPHCCTVPNGIEIRCGDKALKEIVGE